MLSHSLYALFRHVPAPLDLLDVHTADQHMFAFLVLNWGFFADVDIESECLRALGSLRFPIYALDRIIRMHTSPSALRCAVALAVCHVPTLITHLHDVSYSNYS